MTWPDIITPNTASQKNSKAPNASATSPNNGVNSAGDNAEQRAGHRAGGGDAHGAACLSLTRKRVAVEAGGGVRSGAGMLSRIAVRLPP